MESSDYEARFNFGKSVCLAVEKSTNKFVTLKRITADNYFDEDFKKICDEITLIKDCKHKNIIKIHAVFVRDFDLCVVYPFFGFGSCKEAIKNLFFTGFPEIIAALILKDVLLAIDYLHSRGIIHR
jgi:serine/threonine protein kinase